MQQLEKLKFINICVTSAQHQRNMCYAGYVALLHYCIKKCVDGGL